MTCIRIQDLRSAAWTPCCSTTCSPTRDAADARPRHPARRRSRSAHYIVITGPDNTALRDRVDEMLRGAMRDGSLEAIFRKWNIWNDDQPPLFARVLAPTGRLRRRARRRRPRHGPSRDWRRCALSAVVAAAALLTLVLSCAAMLLAVALAWASRPAASTAGRSCAGADGLRRGDARHAGPAAAVRHLLRPGGVIRLPAFMAALLGSAELRRLRERDLSQRARGGAAGTAGSGAHLSGSPTCRRCDWCAAPRRFGWRWRR